MGAVSTDKVRNVVLVGHGGAGKTSLAEAMLFMAGETKRLGAVEGGHSNLDYDPEELKRTMTINLALAPLVHKGVKINVIDTPGYADFIGDAIAAIESRITLSATKTGPASDMMRPMLIENVSRLSYANACA